MRLQHTSVVKMLPYANDKCTGCQTMGQLCKEFFHQQQKKLQPLNKFSNNSLSTEQCSLVGQAQSSLMAKVTPQHTLDPLQVAGKEVRWGLAQETLCLGAASSQPQVSCKCLPQGVERWPSPVHAWMGGLLTQPGKSCSWALVTPLTTKQYHSASENKICIYVTSPSSPALPSRDSRGSMLQTWSNSSGLLVTSEHLLGLNHSACPWGNQRRGWGRSGVGV